MKCQNCNAEIGSDAKFCPKCGTPVSPIPLPEIEQTKEEKSSSVDVQTATNQKAKDQGKYKKWILIALAILLLSAGIGGGSMFVNAGKSSDYQETISMANRYYNRQDYEKAEEYYLQSIEILPKQKEPYVQLVQIYTIWQQPENVEAIIAKAQENLPAADADEVKLVAYEAEKQVEEQKQNALQTIGYEAYAEILETMLDGYMPAEFQTDGYFTDGRMPGFESHGKLDLRYGLKDINDDGIDELFVLYGDTYDKYGTGFVFTFNNQTGIPQLFYRGGVSFQPMTNGFIKYDLNRFKSAASELDPIMVEKFNSETETYEDFFMVEEFDKALLEKYPRFRQGSDGEVAEVQYPDQFDQDKDGYVYRVVSYSSEEEQFLDNQEAEDFFNEKTDNAKTIEVVYEEATPEAIARLKDLANGNSQNEQDDQDTSGSYDRKPEDYSGFPTTYANYDRLTAEGVYLTLKEDGTVIFDYQLPDESGSVPEGNHMVFEGKLTGQKEVEDLHYTALLTNVQRTGGTLDMASDMYSEMNSFESDADQSIIHIYLEGYPSAKLDDTKAGAVDWAAKATGVRRVPNLQSSTFYIESINFAMNGR